MTEKQAEYATKRQTIFRTVKDSDNPFVMMDRRPLENDGMSWGAKGILAYLLSRPDNWKVRLRDLLKRSPDGVYKVRGYIKELKAHGHVQHVPQRDPQTQQILEYVYEVYELPFSTKPLTNLPQAGLPQAGNLAFNNTYSGTDMDSNDIGAHAPDLPLDWQIAAGSKTLVLPDEKKARIKDAANLIAMGLGVHSVMGYQIAEAFMESRDIIIPEGKIKGQRKAVREMIEMNVRPEHVQKAVKQLLDKKMTVVDLFSVSKTAIDLANKPSRDQPTELPPDELERLRQQAKEMMVGAS